MKPDSDLAVTPLVVALILAVLAVFSAFFFVGAVVGILVLIALVGLGIATAAQWIGRNDLG